MTLHKDSKRVLVCGGRDFYHWGILKFAMETHIGRFRGPNSNITIIQGGAKGADFLAKAYADYVGFECEEYLADWNKYKGGAGPIRNKQMLVEGKPDLVIAFRGGSGTANMIRQAKAAGVPVEEVK